MSWVLAILVLSGDMKGELIELAVQPTLAWCEARARDFNAMDNGAGPRIKFVCIRPEET